jgi:sigma-E factor negative regulatory protein RseA
MNEELDSQLSAMFDDELAPEECQLLARRLSRDEQLKARWGRYAVIGAAIRAERGVRLNARIAGRVRVIMSSEPALGTSEGVRRATMPRWARPLAGAAVAAGVAAVAILWLRAQETVPLAALTGVRAPLTTAAAANPSGSPARSLRAVPHSPDSYTVPAAQHAQEAVVPPTELANYVVAHSMFSQPVARGNLLSSFMTSEAPAVASPAMAAEPPPDPSRDAQSQAQ